MQTNLRKRGNLLYSDGKKLEYNQPVGRLVQLVRTPLLHRGGRGFESLTAHRGIPTPIMGEGFVLLASSPGGAKQGHCPLI
jgi:hypothetical protein